MREILIVVTCNSCGNRLEESEVTEFRSERTSIDLCGNCIHTLQHPPVPIAPRVPATPASAVHCDICNHKSPSERGLKMHQRRAHGIES